MNNNKFLSESNVSTELGSMSENAMILECRNLTVFSKQKILLDNVNCCIKNGMTAIMGGSGSGKTTLLNAIAKRLNPSIFKVVGKRYINGEKYNKRMLKKISGYVLQDDIVHASLTIYETLYYHAELRLSCNQKNRIDEVLNIMNLEHVKNIIVGNSIKKGISGGERKRLCIGIELLSEPKILFLDEPTSGLDSFTTYNICKCLKNLTNCLIISTIHQPSSKVFDMFDDLILLKKGELVYHGATKSVLNVYSSVGYLCPEHMNPSEFIIETIHIEKESVKKIKDMLQPPVVIENYDKIDINVEEKSWLKQFYILSQREINSNLSNWKEFMMNCFTTFLVGLIIGGIFNNIGTHQKSVQLRLPVIFFCVISQGINASLQGTHTFPLEREIVLRERASGCYHISAYFLSKTVIDIIFTLPLPIIFSFSSYFLIGLRSGVNHFIIFTLYLILTHIAATSLAVSISTIAKTISMSVTIMPLLFEINRLFAGFFVPPGLSPKYLKWLEYLCYSSYAYIGASINELQNLQLTCDPNEYINNVCPITNGNSVIISKGFNEYSINKCFLGLVIDILITKLISYLALRFLVW